MCLLSLPADATGFRDPLTPEQRAYVESHGPFTVAMGPTGPPFAFEDEGEVRGIIVDLLRMMEIDLDIEFEAVIFATFAQGYAALENGTVDAVAPALPGHEGPISFTQPLAWARFGFWVGPEMAWAQGPEDLAGHTVAVPDSDGVRGFLAEFPDITPLVVTDMRAAAQKVVGGEAAAAFGGYANMGYYSARAEFAGLRPLGPPTHVTQSVAAVSSEDPLLGILDMGLARLGDQQRLAVYMKWTGIDLGPPLAASRESVSAAWWVVGAAVGALAVLLASSAVLRRQVRARTADLAAEHAKLERIMETSPGGLAVVEPDGTLAYANRRAEQLLGLHRDTLEPDRYVEPPWHIVNLKGQPFPADDLPVPTVLRTGQPVHDVRYAIEWGDGRRVPLSVNAAPLVDTHGRIAAVVTAFEDLTAQLAVQEAERVEFLRRIEMERLQEIDRFRREFINAAAHELKNPLTPLSVQLHLLEREMRLLPPAHRQSITILRRNLDRLSRLVSDMLDVTRLEAGHMPLDVNPIDLADVAHESVGSLEAVAAQKGITLKLDAQAGLVDGDMERLSQVLYNLIGNAIKYTPDGGRIRVAVYQDDDAVVVDVEDTGLGLSREQIDVLFEPFSRVHDAQVPGTGLGLHISRGIAEAHGGSLTCRSAGPGRGSVFTLRVPASRTVPEPPMVLAGS